MTLRLAINGFGRIGRSVLRALHERNLTAVEIVAVNDLAAPATNAHLLQFDSVHGPFPGLVMGSGDKLSVNGKNIALFSERDPANLPWKDLNIDIVLECTGIFTAREKAAAHLKAGAKKVLISAPSPDADATVVYGVNHQTLTPKHTVVSNASCTTNCLAPVAKVLHEAIGIEHGLMTTVHSYTNDQSLLDVAHKDLRRARAAALSMIPTSTGAAKAVGLVLPELKGKLDGFALRVPTPNVSVVDLTFVPSKATSSEEIHAAIDKAATHGPLHNVLAVNRLELVSTDFNHHPASSLFDITQTRVMEGGKLVKILSWYDNEWGFANRMLDVAGHMGHV